MFVVAGESLVDLVSEPRGADGVIRMHAHQGGSPYNCAIALARLGNDAGYLCPISRDGFGDYLLEPLLAAGVRPLMEQRVAAPSTLAVVTLDAAGKAQYEFYRGADRAATLETALSALPPRIDLFQIGGFLPIEPDDATLWLEVSREAARRGATLSIDPNVRPSLIADFDGYKRRLSAFLDLAHIIKVSNEDLETLNPHLPVQEQARELLARPNCRLVVVTLGEHGSLAFSKSGEATADIWSPPVFGDTVGAGDSLMAGVLCFLRDESALSPAALTRLDSPTLSRMLRFGAVVAGLNCAQKGCNPPTREEVDAVLQG